jgi:hypothetical protein
MRAVSGRPTAGYLGWTGHANMGDEAIRQAVVGALPGVELIEVPLGMRATVRAVHRIPGLRRGPLVLGGGTVLGRRIWRYHLRQAFALTGGGAHMLGAGVEDPAFERPGHLSEGRELPRWRGLLAGFDAVTVRGPRSAELLADAGIDATVIGDPALLLDPPATGEIGSATGPAADGRLLGVNLGVSDDLWGHDQAGVVEAVAATVAGLSRDGWRFRVLVVNPADADDARRCGQLAGLGPQRWEVVAADDPADYLRAVAPCRVVVAERLHAAVLAVRLGIPTVALEYQPKCRDFMRSVGAEDLSVRTDALDPVDLGGMVADADVGHAVVSAGLTARVAALRVLLLAEADRLGARCRGVEAAAA